MNDVIDNLINEHKITAKLMKLIRNEVGRFISGELPDWDLVSEVLEYLDDFPRHHHHPKENVIFQRLKQCSPKEVEAIGELEKEHRKLNHLTARFAAAIDNVLQDNTLSRDWFAEIANDYLKFQHHHMTMEEVVFFPAAKKFLSEEDWLDINDVIGAANAPELSYSLAERYALLDDEIDLSSLAVN